MSTYDTMMQCKPVAMTQFKAMVLGLRYAFCAEVPTETGRLVLIRAGDDRGQLVGYREDYLDKTFFYVR